MEIQHVVGPTPYGERIAALRADLRAIERQLGDLSGEGILRDRLLDRMRPLYDDLFALLTEIEVGEPRQV